MSRVYTGKGDDGSTGLLFGGRVAKDHVLPEAYGSVDEAQAAIGLARAATERGSELDEALLAVERDLYVLMAELATQPENRHKLVDGQTRVTDAMVVALSASTDAMAERFAFPTEFALPGQSELSARLDVARTVVRRAERRCLPAAGEGSHAVPYLNRLSSLLWTAARWVEADDTILAKSVAPRQPGDLR
jgi:cob(I)alamin adenosyltransferase